MKIADRSLTDTVPIPLPAKLGCVLTVAAFTSTSSLLDIQPTFFPTVSLTSSTSYKLEDAAIPATAATAKVGFTVDEAADSIQSFLAREGMIVDRIVTTGDGSRLLQFLGSNKACVDVYPAGDVVVLIRKAGVDNIYELALKDVNIAVRLLKDAGVGV